MGIFSRNNVPGFTRNNRGIPMLYSGTRPYRATASAASAHATVDIQGGDGGKGGTAYKFCLDIRRIRGNKEKIITFRFSGASQAGHTNYHLGKLHVHKQVPTGMLVEGVEGFTSKTVDFQLLLEEINVLEEKYHLKIKDRLHIFSDSALLLGLHVDLNHLKETAEAKGSIGRGAGEAAESPFTFGRFVDVLTKRAPEADLKNQLAEYIAKKKKEAETIIRDFPHTARFYNPDNFNAEKVFEKYLGYSRLFQNNIKDPDYILKAYNDGASIVGEGSQGALLHRTKGPIPNVTKYNILVDQLQHYSMVPIDLFEIIASNRLYGHRHAEGSLPTKIKGGLIQPDETTWNPWPGEFQVGWFDMLTYCHGMYLEAEAYAKLKHKPVARVRNPIDSVVMRHADIIDALPIVQVCTGYPGFPLQKDKRSKHKIPLGIPRDIAGEDFRRFLEAAQAAQQNLTFRLFEGFNQSDNIVKFIEEESGVRVSAISRGVYPDQLIRR